MEIDGNDTFHSQTHNINNKYVYVWLFSDKMQPMSINRFFFFEILCINFVIYYCIKLADSGSVFLRLADTFFIVHIFDA